MPRTLTFPIPSTEVCPVCDERLSDVPCTSCGADLRRPESEELFQIDRDLHRLSVRRSTLVEGLLAPSQPPADPAVSAAIPVPPPPPPMRSPDAGRGQGASGWSAAEILVGLGGLSLIAAVVVFAAVAWSDLAAWAQGGLLFAATGAVFAAAVASRRRGLTATAESLGVVSVTLGLADIEVVRTALDGVVAGRIVWSVGLVLVAGAALAAGRTQGLRGVSAAGAAIAFMPLPLAVAGLDAATAVWWAVACQAVAAAIIVERLPDRSLERSVVVGGAVLSWIIAAMSGLGGAIAALDRTPESVPVASVALLVGLSVTSIAVGWTQRIRPLVVGGLASGFIPAVLAAAAGSPSMVAAALVGQCALGVAGVTAVRRVQLGDQDARVVAAALNVGAAMSAVGAVAVATVLGLVELWFESGAVSVAAVGTFLALAGVAVVGVIHARWERAATAVVLVSAVASVFAGAWLASASSAGPDTTTVVMLIGGAMAMMAAVLAGRDVRQPWMAPLVAAGAGVAVASVIPVAAAAAAVVALAEVAVPSVDVAAGASYVDHLGGATSIEAIDLPSSATLTQLVGLAVVGVSGLLIGRLWARWVLAFAGVVALVAVPVVVGASVGLTALLYAAALAVVLWRLVSIPDDALAVVVGSILAVLLVGVSLANPGLTVATTALVTGGLSLLAYRSLTARGDTASWWVAAALLSGLGGVTVDALRVGSAGSTPAMAAVCVAAVASLTGPSIDRWRCGDESGASPIADVVVGATLLIATLSTRSLDAASVAVAIIGVVAGVHALRPTRRPLLGVAIASTVVLTWMRLDAADITLLEAYTLPLAGALLLGGALVRPGSRSSWVRNGSGLFAALGPSAFVAIADGDLTRTIFVVLGGAAVAVWGAVEGEQAPLAIGGAAVSAIAVRHLGPVANELPRYVTFAVAGIGLLAAGATFEQRRRDLRRARDAFGRLG